MSLRNSSLISIDDLTNEDIQEVFRRSDFFQKIVKEKRSFEDVLDFKESRKHTAFLVFVEPSTRTRISFEMACHHLGINVAHFSDVSSSSVTKGETIEVTMKILEALKPSLIVLRHKGHSAPTEKTPVINAGFGSYEHPTQALVDAWTIQKVRGQIKNEKVLVVGDVLHSRVSNSNFKILKRLGADVAICSPQSLRPQSDTWANVKAFPNLYDGVKWATVVMCLRIQTERHATELGVSTAEYRDKYLLGEEHLKVFNQDGIILHPGPYICGVEISKEILSDPRCHIITQVENSLAIRTAIVSLILGFQLKQN